MCSSGSSRLGTSLPKEGGHWPLARHVWNNPGLAGNDRTGADADSQAMNLHYPAMFDTAQYWTVVVVVVVYSASYVNLFD